MSSTRWLSEGIEWPVEPGEIAVPLSRKLLAGLIADLGLPLSNGAVKDALLCLSEVLTNAVKHAGAASTIRVHWSKDVLRVGVTDTSLRLPKAPDPDDLSTSGRGLDLVDKFSTAWGWEPIGAGKEVWFEITRDQVVSGEERLPVLVRRAHQVASNAPEAPPSNPPRRRIEVAPLSPADAAPPLAQRTPGLAWAAFATA